MRAFDLRPNKDCEHETLKQVLDEFDKYFVGYQTVIFASFYLIYSFEFNNNARIRQDNPWFCETKNSFSKKALNANPCILNYL